MPDQTGQGGLENKGSLFDLKHLRGVLQELHARAYPGGLPDNAVLVKLWAGNLRTNADCLLDALEWNDTIQEIEGGSIDNITAFKHLGNSFLDVIILAALTGLSNELFERAMDDAIQRQLLKLNLGESLKDKRRI